MNEPTADCLGLFVYVSTVHHTRKVQRTFFLRIESCLHAEHIFFPFKVSLSTAEGIGARLPCSPYEAENVGPGSPPHPKEARRGGVIILHLSRAPVANDLCIPITTINSTSG